MKEEELLEMQKAILDPASLQIASLNRLDKALDGKYDIVDPNNPFAFLMENTTMLTASMMQKTENSIRQIYPVLANNKKDLYHHINDTEINNIMSVPGEAIFNLFFNLNDIINNGIESNYCYEITVPKNSFINVDGVLFTILNNIVIKYFKNGGVYVEAIYDTLDLAFNTNRTLESSITTNNDGTDFLMVSLPVKQVKRYKVKETLLLKQPFIKDVVIDDYFTYLTARSISTSLKKEIPLEKTFSEFVYNPLTPSILIKPMDNLLRLEIPSVYIINNTISSYVDMEIFTTKGNINLELSTYNSDEFEMTYDLSEIEYESSSIINSVNCFITASTNIYGGKNEITFEELKNKVINYSTGDNKLPITLQEVNDFVVNNGYQFMFTTDTIVKREFTISKYLGNLEYDITSNIDLFIGKLDLNLSNVFSSKIIFDENSITITPYQRFKLKNGTLIPLTDNETLELSDMSKNDLARYNTEEYFLNPYLYILDYKDNLRTRVYDINQPDITNPVTVYNNSPITPVEFINRTIERKDFTYDIKFVLGSSNKILKLDPTKVRAQIDLSLDDNNSITYRGELKYDDLIGSYIHFIIPIEGYINNEDKMLFIDSISKVDNAFINIHTNLTFSIYNTSEEISDVDGYDVSTILDDEVSAVLYKEVVDVRFANNLNSIYRNYNVNFLERKFKTYDKDIHLTYKTNIYELDDDGTVKLEYNERTGVEELVLKHSVGDDVLDENGNKIILHRTGDIILNDNDEPIIDYINGLTHNIDLLLIEDSFARITDLTYREYVLEYLQHLSLIPTKEIPLLEKSLTENTSFKLTALNSLNKVTIRLNDEWVSFNNFVEPTITINLLRGTTIVVDDELEAKLATALQELLSDNIMFNEAEEKLKEVVGGDVISVRLSDIIDSEISNIKYKEGSGRFILSKQLLRNNNGDTIVASKIKISVVAI